VRLFAATLAALALTLALVLGIGAILTHQQVDRSQAAQLARNADTLAQQRRQSVNYKTEDTPSGQGRIIIQRRAYFVELVPNVNKSSDGQTTYLGDHQLYSYRTLPSLGLLMLRPASLRAAAWHPFLGDLVLAAAIGVVFAAFVSFFLARSIVGPIRRVVDAIRAFPADERHEPLRAEGTRELTALAEAFNQMSAQLARSHAAERDFLLSVSHELKTPLTAIRGYAEGLSEGAFEVDEAARTILVESHRLERLVYDLLDLARMHRSEFSVRTEPVDLLEIARESAHRHEATARELDVELAAAGTESWVEADHDRLLQVASNLVENAMREAPAGGRVTVTAEAGRLLVSDTGAGIPPEDVPHAFERFYLYDKIGRGRPVGSGLGLAIVKQLVTAMKGEVRVESGAGGTTFAVVLRPQVRGVDHLEVSTGQRPERV
jgi:two-component system sensor histidine kinase BaeS